MLNCLSFNTGSKLMTVLRFKVINSVWCQKIVSYIITTCPIETTLLHKILILIANFDSCIALHSLAGKPGEEPGITGDT